MGKCSSDMGYNHCNHSNMFQNGIGESYFFNSIHQPPNYRT